MIGAGVGRILTSHAWELYNEWMKETEKVVTFTPKEELEKPKTEPKPLPPELPCKPNPQTDYRCRLEGTQLKFY
jgi:hypothetical protein